MQNLTPSEKFNLPVIGKIFCKLQIVFNQETLDSPVDEYEVIKVIERDGKKTYICNCWYEENEPQMVPDICVVKFEEY